jgi:hypothetical protein
MSECRGDRVPAGGAARGAERTAGAPPFHQACRNTGVGEEVARRVGEPLEGVIRAAGNEGLHMLPLGMRM